MKYVYLPLMCGLLVLAGCGDNNADSTKSTDSNSSETNTDVTLVADDAVEAEDAELNVELNNSDEALASDLENVEEELIAEAELEDDYFNPQAGIPNIWRYEFGQGFDSYSINDAKGTTLTVNCNSGAGGGYDNSVYLDYRGESYTNSDSDYPVVLLVDDAIEVSASESTNWRNGAIGWVELAENVSQATKIDVYLNNKKVATFTPSPENVRRQVSDLANCEPMFTRGSDW